MSDYQAGAKLRYVPMQMSARKTKTTVLYGDEEDSPPPGLLKYWGFTVSLGTGRGSAIGRGAVIAGTTRKSKGRIKGMMNILVTKVFSIFI
ncbi:hypothetical protein L486_05519 [Kwoniella mangroviensis CBS 10435]|uniref:Uncharacterized protein n=1 Tax=Kwoniella mangroviensis CBS 10435 TaxID=1331196 RepID=A0A1B9IM48_9TREE|nr:hypothetical protein L486_05519 [Kwoniella mangroviensis CBS 10435]